MKKLRSLRGAKKQAQVPNGQRWADRDQMFITASLGMMVQCVEMTQDIYTLSGRVTDLDRLHQITLDNAWELGLSANANSALQASIRLDRSDFHLVLDHAAPQPGNYLVAVPNR